MRLILSLFFIGVMCVQAQQNEESRAFFVDMEECAGSIGGWKCLELDLSSELASENDSSKTYEYSWNFGDGNRINGATVEHCYNTFGSYQVTMDLIDEETNTVIRNELSATVSLYPETFPTIGVSIEDQPPGFMEFTSHFGDESEFFPDRVFWRVDGAHYQGRSIVHSFPVAGTYVVEMGVEKDTDFFGTVSACATREITIKDTDVWSSGISAFFNAQHGKLKTGPFAAQEVMCYLKAADATQKEPSVLPLTQLMGAVDLKKGSEYEVMLFAGGVFTGRKRINTHDIEGNDIYRALKDTVSSFVTQPLVVIPSLRVGLDEIEVSDETSLQQTAAVLLAHPYFRIEIGAYLHTGSRYSKGISTSLKRALSVRDALVDLGISRERVLIASPENNSALMNSCSAMSDCGIADEEYDGKIEFRITGASL